MIDQNIEKILNWSAFSIELYPMKYVKIGDKIIKNHKKKFIDNHVILFSFGFKKEKKKKKYAIWHDGLFLYEPGTETIRYGRILKKDKQIKTNKILKGGTKDGACFISYAIPVSLSSERIYLTFEIILNKDNYEYIIKRIGYNQSYIRDVFNNALARNPESMNIINEILNKCKLIDRFPLQEKDTMLNEINRLYSSQ